ncbi:hypothetical protein KAJ27_23575 [bacterium]|nr:hypothetical protein [bacterium]
MGKKKGFRIKNEYCWGNDRPYQPFYSEGIDHIKSMYKDICGIDSSGIDGGLGDEYARDFLSSANRIPKEIINDILTNIEYLNDECDAALYSAKLSCLEYDNVMKVVQRAGLKFRQDGLADVEIWPWVTKLVKGMLAERKQCGKINSKAWLLEWESRIGYGKKVPKAATKPFRVPKKKTFSYSPGVTKAVFGPKTVEDIQKKFCQISRDLENLPAIDSDSVEPFKKGLVQAVCDLADIGVSLKDLEKNQSGGDGWEQ